jgi:hypothetical protein
MKGGYMRKFMTSVLICLFWAGLVSAGALQARADDWVKNGFYRVLRVSGEQETLLPLGKNEIIVESSPLFLEPGEKVRYIVLAEKPHVLLALREKPVKVKDPTERTKSWLQLRLTESAARELEIFTRANLGASATMVVGGRSLTVHTIRSVMQDGRWYEYECAS